MNVTIQIVKGKKHTASLPSSSCTEAPCQVFITALNRQSRHLSHMPRLLSHIRPYTLAYSMCAYLYLAFVHLLICSCFIYSEPTVFPCHIEWLHSFKISSVSIFCSLMIFFIDVVTAKQYHPYKHILVDKNLMHILNFDRWSSQSRG